MSRLDLGLALLGCLALSGCPDKQPTSGKNPKALDTAPTAPSTSTTPADARPSERPSQKLVPSSDHCDLDHRGLVLDLGNDAIESRRGYRLSGEKPLTTTVHEARRYAQLDQTNERFSIWIPEEISDYEITAQVHGTESERIAFYIDERRLGSARLTAGKTSVVRVGGSKEPIPSGLHHLSIHLSRPKRGNVGADVSWVRLGPSGTESDELPPTRDETVTEVTIGEERQRSVVLRAGSAMRCPVWLPPKAELSTSLGLWGAGKASVQISVITDRGAREILLDQDIEMKEGEGTWLPIHLDLSRYGNSAAAIEIRAPKVSEGARLALREPLIIEPARPTEPPHRARRAIVFVLSGLDARHAPAEAAAHGLPLLAPFARSASHFIDYQTKTSSAVGVMASLLTGTSPTTHQMEGDGLMLRSELPSLAESLEAEGGRAAFFTGVPTSFAGFGFDRGFEKFVSTSPTEDIAATAPITEAKAWLARRWESEDPILLFVHLRGGHPPFDIPRETARALPPKEYGGELDPRRAAIQLADVRAREKERHRRLPDDDWTRLDAMRERSLLDQSAALTGFLSWLGEKDPNGESMVVIMGDVASGRRPTLPFADGGPLTDEYLKSLLLIRFAGGQPRSGTRSGTFSTEDITATLAHALGVKHERLLNSGIDLSRGDAAAAASERPHVAYLDGKYTAFLGAFRLSGQDGKTPRLCQVQLDPSCLEDRSSENVLVTRALLQSTWAELREGLSQEKRPQARKPDEALDRALFVWGLPR